MCAYCLAKCIAWINSDLKWLKIKKNHRHCSGHNFHCCPPFIAWKWYYDKQNLVNASKVNNKIYTRVFIKNVQMPVTNITQHGNMIVPVSD